MAVMFDTSVIIDAMLCERGHTSKKVQAALHALRSADAPPIISTITLFELEFGFDDAQRKRLSRWGFRVEIVDPPIARRAAELLRISTGAPDVCEKCLGIMPPAACPKCGGQATKQRKMHDAYIVATGELRSDIDRLYSTDGGMLHLGTFAKNVAVEEPPDPPATPLELPFPAVEEPTPVELAKKPPGKRRK